MATVLVIDDDPAVHELLRRSLGRSGLPGGGRPQRRGRPAHGAQDPPRRHHARRHDAGHGRLDRPRALKADPDLAPIPVIMLTIVDEKNRGYSLGAADYLTKPIERERLRKSCMRYRHTMPGEALVVEDDPASRE